MWIDNVCVRIVCVRAHCICVNRLTSLCVNREYILADDTNDCLVLWGKGGN